MYVLFGKTDVEGIMFLIRSSVSNSQDLELYPPEFKLLLLLTILII